MSVQPTEPQDAPIPQDASVGPDEFIIDPFMAAYGEEEGGRYVEAFGNRYALKDKQPGMVMLRFSKMAANGISTDDPAGGAIMFDLLASVFTAAAWERFEPDAEAVGASMEELFAVVKQAVSIINGFPTTPPSPSSTGQLSTTPSSTVSSFEERKRALGLVPVTPESLAELAG